MASCEKFISFLLLMTLLSMQVHGRESQFFSKVSNTNSQQKVPENEIIPNDNQHQEEQQEQNEPGFMPENKNTGYGLYGHETGPGDLPSTTPTTANLPYKPESEEYNSYPNTQNNNYYDNRYSFNGKNQNEFGNSKFSQSGYNNQKAYFNGGKNNYNVEKQGMSDTRFLENGKYFYDINSENNPNSNQYENAKNELPSSWNWNNNGGYYGQNNQNSYEYRNSIGGYQNNEEPEQFQFQPNEFEP